jgi:hypothetical protein
MQSTARDIEPYWIDESDWLSLIEFLPQDDEEDRAIGAEAIGYLFGYAQLTDTRMLALIGDPDSDAYELLFSFVSREQKAGFLDLVDSYEYFTGAYAEGEFGIPTADEIRAARPLGMVLPEDVMRHATLIATTLLAGSDDCNPAS